MKPVGMSRILLLLSLLAAVSASSSSSAPRKSSQDQYESQDNQAQTQSNEHKPHLHRVQLTSSGLHRFGLIPPGKQKPAQNDKVQELQTGCGDGSVKVPQNTEVGVKVIKKREVEDTNPENNRKKRDYIRWFGASTSHFNPPIQSFQIHGIQTSQTPVQFNLQYHRPAYSVVIPLWGNPSSIPVFFPQKPILFNPGYPVGNRPNIPFNPVSTEKPEEPAEPIPTMPLANRFGGPEDEDGPVWGIVESQEDTGAIPATSRPSQSAPRTTTSRPSAISTPPPLFHRPSHGEEGEGNIPGEMAASTQQGLQSVIPIQRPTTTQRPRTTQTTTTAAPARQLNRCVWAIISCCNPTNTQIRYNCFENLGCPGAFWDRNPCSKEVTQAALNAAQAFYDES